MEPVTATFNIQEVLKCLTEEAGVRLGMRPTLVWSEMYIEFEPNKSPPQVKEIRITISDPR